MRLGGVFGPMWLPAMWQTGWYFGTDLFFLFGFTGLFAWQSPVVGIGGLIGYLLGFAGVLVIRTWPGSYVIGAGMFLFGVVIFAAWLLGRSSLPKWIPGLWIASFVASIVELVFVWAPNPFIISGTLFSLGFIAAGWKMFRRPAAAN